jgi:hypothetical protein
MGIREINEKGGGKAMIPYGIWHLVGSIAIIQSKPHYRIAFGLILHEWPKNGRHRHLTPRTVFRVELTEYYYMGNFACTISRLVTEV